MGRLKENLKETLVTERLILRPLSVADAEAAYMWASDVENTRYMAWPTHDGLKHTMGWLVKTKAGRDFGVTIGATGELIGSCGIYPTDDDGEAEVGWILRKDCWKRGYGAEFGAALIKYGFEGLKLRRIAAHCAAVNYGSYRVMERNGMTREGLFRKAFWVHADKEWVDRAVYAIMAEDYFAKASPMVGRTGSASVVVCAGNTAKAVGSGEVNVFATPSMIALMEAAAINALKPCMENGQTTVGTAINAQHTAASPVGANITATATVLSVNGRQAELSVAASDGGGEVGRGRHTRVIVNAERFEEKSLWRA